MHRNAIRIVTCDETSKGNYNVNKATQNSKIKFYGATLGSKIDTFVQHILK